jgi:dTDP-glucose 4,6-dehydratase
VVFLITGGAGFIGSTLIKELVKDSNNIIINVDNLSYSGNLLSLKDLGDYQNYKFEYCDINNAIDINIIIQKYQPNIIFHFAAETHVDRSIDSPKEFINTNIVGTYNLLQSAKELYYSNISKSGFSFKFHHISTDEVFGDIDSDDSATSEDAPYKPSSPYAASKASADHLVRSWSRTFDIPFIITHCSNNYGPYQFPEKLIPHTIINALKGNKIPIYGDGMQQREWLYVGDHAEALIKLIYNGQVNTSYNIGSSEEMHNLDVVKTICVHLDNLDYPKPKNISSFKRLITFVEDRPGHDKRYSINSEKIFRDVGWAPKEDFQSGILKTIEWYISNKEWWEAMLQNGYLQERKGLGNV